MIMAQESSSPVSITRLIEETGEWIEEDLSFEEFVEIFLSAPIDNPSTPEYNDAP